MSSSGYSSLTPNTVNIILQRYSTNRFSFDSFVACCVRLKSLTGMCRHKMPGLVIGSSESTLRKSPSSCRMALGTCRSTVARSRLLDLKTLFRLLYRFSAVKLVRSTCSKSSRTQKGPYHPTMEMSK